MRIRRPSSAALSAFALLFAWLVLTPVAALAVDAGSKRAMTHEDLWSMRRVGAPVPSPDGRWVVFSVTEPAYDEQEQVSDLWIVPADGSASPRRLTQPPGGGSGVDWSPDGRQIAFGARRVAS